MKKIREILTVLTICGIFLLWGCKGASTSSGGGGRSPDGTPPQLVAVETSSGGIADFKFNEDMGRGYSVTCTGLIQGRGGWIDSPRRTFRIYVSLSPGMRASYTLNPEGYGTGFTDASGERLPETKGSFIVQ